MRKVYKIIISLIIISILISPVFALDNQSDKKPVTYKILIDQMYGFYRIYEINDKMFGKEILQENHTFNISKGDTIVFVNDAIPDKFITIVSEEKLWSEKNGTLKHSGKELWYTFNKSGIYNIYIRQRTTLKQKIIVEPLDMNSTNMNNTKSNLTNDTKPGRTNATNINNTKSNLTSNQNNVTNMTQNSTINKSGSAPMISINLTDKLFSKIKSKSDVSIMTMILLMIYVLSGRIKDD